MRTIKFRGRDIDTGKFIYAELGEIVEERQGYYAFLSVPGTAVVTDKSLAQLVGYDKNGNEVYEGDQLIYANELWTAHLGSYMRNSATLCHYNFKQAVLKENDNEIQNAAAQN